MLSTSCLEHGNGEDTSGETNEGLGGWESGSASVGLNGAAWALGHGAVGWGLDLSVGDLRNNGGSLGGRRGSSWSLDLAVGDLGDWGDGGGWGLNLTVGDLGNNTGWALNLTVGDLGNDTSRALDLTVGDLRDHGSGVLDLAVRDLRGNWGGSDLAVTDLAGNGATTRDDVDVDRAALAGSVVVVEVVEGTAQALLEDSVGAEDEGVVVGADGPAGVVDGAGLSGVVELELVVGGDVADTALGILQDTAAEGEHEGGTLVKGLSLALAGRGDIDDLDLESARVVALAGGGGAGGGSNWSRGGVGSASEGESSDGVTHYDGCLLVVVVVVVVIKIMCSEAII